MTPKVRTNVVYIKNWSRKNRLSLRRAAMHLQDAAKELPAELGGIQAAVSQCLQSANQLELEVNALLESEELARLGIDDELTDSEQRQLLALNQQLLKVTRYLRTVVDDVKPRLDAKLADPNDLMWDYEIEARIDYQLREDDREFAEEDDNYLSTRTESLKSRSDGWARKDCAESCLPAGLLVEPHCWLFKDLYSNNYGAESPSLSFKDCLRIGRIFVDVQIWQQYEFSAQGGSPCDAKRRILDDNDVMKIGKTESPNPPPPWSASLQLETREVMNDATVTADGRLHFKHRTLGYAYAKVDELSNSRLLLYRKPDGDQLWFDDVDAMLQAGWVID